MGLNVTLGTMRTRVRQRAFIENSSVLTDDEIDDLINEGLNEVYDMLVKARGHEYYRSSTSFATSAGISMYALPAQFFEILSVDITYANNLVISARQYTEEERNAYRSWPGWMYNSPVFWRLVGGNINFIPTPSGIFQIAVNYVPSFVPLSGSSDSFDGVSGWESYAVWKAVAFAYQKQQRDATFALSMVGGLKERIEALSVMRNAGEAPRVRDVYVYDDDWGFRR